MGFTSEGKGQVCLATSIGTEENLLRVLHRKLGHLYTWGATKQDHIRNTSLRDSLSKYSYIKGNGD